jgi:hypothetical protein
MQDDHHCEICGRQPAMRFTIRRHVGMLLWQKFYKIDAPLCREHALAIGRAFLARTLVQGWWGVTSFFFNIAAVLTDTVVLIRAGSMKNETSDEDLAPRIKLGASRTGLSSPE